MVKGGGTLSGAFMLAMTHVEVMGQGQGMGFGNAWMLRWCYD